MASKGYQTGASQFPGKDAIGKPMGSRDDDWVTVEGVRYVPETPLKAEIADLQSANKLLHNLIDNKGAEIDRLSDECRERARIEHKLRTALEEVYLSVKPLLPAGWSDARHVMNVISGALTKEGK